MSHMALTATRPSPMRLLVALLATASLVLAGSVATTQHADASQSNTREDPFGTLELAGSNWLGGIGANVYSNGNSASYDSGQYHYVATPSGSVQSGLKWQCVELVNRLYLQNGWTTSRWTGNGGQMYDTAPGHLSKQPNGSITNLQAGDVVIFQDNGYGHVGIVGSVSGGSVSIVNQNTRSVFISGTLNGGTLSVSGLSGYTVKGVVHRPAGGNPPVQGTSPMVLTNDQGWLWGKDTLTSTTWTNQHAGAEKVVVGGNRIALINNRGELYAKDGIATTTWVDQDAIATDVVVSSTGRMVIINDQGWLWAKDTLSPGGWTNQHAGAEKVAVGGDRIALINNQGRLWAKDGINTSTWIDQGVTVTDVAVGSSGRMVITVPGGGVWAKDTLGFGGWIDQGATAEEIAIGGNRIALINNQGELYAKDTIGLHGWLDQDAIAMDVAVGSSGRMVIINDQGWLWAKDTLSPGGWTNQHAGAEKVAIG